MKINNVFLLLICEYINEFDIHHYYHQSNHEKKTMGDFLPFDIQQYIVREKNIELY